MECEEKEGVECASDEEKTIFFDSHTVILLIQDNFINMAEIDSTRKHIKSTPGARIARNVVLGKRANVEILTLDEHRFILQDSRFNPLDLVPPQEVSFLNFADSSLETNLSENPKNRLLIVIQLSRKVKT